MGYAEYFIAGISNGWDIRI